MSVERLEELAREALAESRRNDCELISVAAQEGAEHSWSIDLLDVMQKQEPFRVTLEAAPASSEEEIKEAIRRGIAEHFSAASY
jgi:DNA-binding transcriptional LysR family regulator